MDNCSIHIKLIIQNRYVDDIFAIFSSKEHLELFVYYMNKQHKYITLIFETKQDNSFSLLNIKTTHHKQQFKTFFHRKSTLSGVFTHYEN